MRAILAVLFLALLGTFVSLGFWQLDRADEKRELFGSFAEGNAAVAATALIEGDALAAHRYERLRLNGRFLSSRQILLDWVTHAGRVGYQVLTPFLPSGSENWVVVNRGWIAAAPDRGELPNLEVTENDRMIVGQIDALPRPGLRLEVPEETVSASWPRALLFPTFDELRAELELPLVDYQLLLAADQPDGFIREWQPRSITPERHQGYALQWFSLAAALVAITAAVTSRAVLRARRSRDERDTGS